MNQRLAGCVVVAVMSGLAFLPACAVRPAPKPAPENIQARVMDLSEIPSLETAPIVFESAAVAGWSRVQPTAEDLAYHAMLMGTAGLPPGEVAAGPKMPLPGSAARAPWAKPVLTFPGLQPEAPLVQTEGDEAWKKSLPPLPHLDAR